MLARFFSRNHTTHQIPLLERDTANILLSDLEHEIKRSAKHKSPISVNCTSFICGTIALLAGVTNLIYADEYLTKLNSDSTFLDEQKNPDTWENPCGDLIADIYKTTSPYDACKAPIFEYSPRLTMECIDYCKKIAREELNFLAGNVGKVIGYGLSYGGSVLFIIVGVAGILSSCSLRESINVSDDSLSINKLPRSLVSRFEKFMDTEGCSIQDSRTANDLRIFCNKVIEKQVDLEAKESITSSLSLAIR